MAGEGSAVKEDWWSELSSKWMRNDKRPPREAKRLGLLAKRNAVVLLRPRSICEIGVRAGYSASAMLTAAPDTRFVGIDLGTKHYGPAGPIRNHAIWLLSKFSDVTLMWQDSHKMQTITPPVDLVHIDGDHSYNGCLMDLKLAKRSGAKWAVVDDVFNLEAVRRAVKKFTDAHTLNVRWIQDGHNGTAIVFMEGEGGP